MSVVMGISDHVVVLDYAARSPTARRSRFSAIPAVIRAYLGEEDKD